MSDLAPVQAELAKRLAAATHVYTDAERAGAYLRAFWVTLKREWQGIDRLRVDKFYSLARAFVRASIEQCKRRRWSSATVEAVTSGWREVVLEGNPLALRLHLADAFIEELAGVAPDISHKHFTALASAFDGVLTNCDNQTVFKRVVENVYKKAGEAILRSAERRSQAAAKAAGGDADGTDEEELSLEDRVYREALRAREPVLHNVDAEALGQHLFSVGADKATRGRHRKLLYAVSKELKSIAASVEEQAEASNKTPRKGKVAADGNAKATGGAGGAAKKPKSASRSSSRKRKGSADSRQGGGDAELEAMQASAKRASRRSRRASQDSEIEEAGAAAAAAGASDDEDAPPQKAVVETPPPAKRSKRRGSSSKGADDDAGSSTATPKSAKGKKKSASKSARKAGTPAEEGTDDARSSRRRRRSSVGAEDEGGPTPAKRSRAAGEDANGGGDDETTTPKPALRRSTRGVTFAAAVDTLGYKQSIQRLRTPSRPRRTTPGKGLLKATPTPPSGGAKSPPSGAERTGSSKSARRRAKASASSGQKKGRKTSLKSSPLVQQAKERARSLSTPGSSGRARHRARAADFF